MNKTFFPYKTGRSTLSYSPAKSLEVAEKLAVFSAVYIHTPAHTRLYSQLDTLRLLGLKTKGRPQRALRCLAPFASGKTAVAEIYTRRINAAVENPEDHLPIVYVSLQNNTTSKRLTSSILAACGDIAHRNGTEAMLKRRILSLFELYKVELLILDEIHHLSHRQNTAEVMNVIKSFLNDAICPVALIGTDDALRLFNNNGEIGQRVLTVGDLKPLGNSSRDRAITSRFVLEMDAALRSNNIYGEASDFIQEEMVDGLHRVSEGILGRIARILQAALEIAIRRNAMRIERLDVIQGIDHWAAAQGIAKSNPFREG